MQLLDVVRLGGELVNQGAVFHRIPIRDTVKLENVLIPFPEIPSVYREFVFRCHYRFHTGVRVQSARSAAPSCGERRVGLGQQPGQHREVVPHPLGAAGRSPPPRRRGPARPAGRRRPPAPRPRPRRRAAAAGPRGRPPAGAGPRRRRARDTRSPRSGSHAGSSIASEAAFAVIAGAEQVEVEPRARSTRPTPAARRPPRAAAATASSPTRRPRNHRRPRCVVHGVPRSGERGTRRRRPRRRPGRGARARAGSPARAPGRRSVRLRWASSPR